MSSRPYRKVRQIEIQFGMEQYDTSRKFQLTDPSTVGINSGGCVDIAAGGG